jgi:hypothetical protein
MEIALIVIAVFTYGALRIIAREINEIKRELKKKQNKPDND